MNTNEQTLIVQPWNTKNIQYFYHPGIYTSSVLADSLADHDSSVVVSVGVAKPICTSVSPMSISLALSVVSYNSTCILQFHELKYKIGTDGQDRCRWTRQVQMDKICTDGQDRWTRQVQMDKIGTDGQDRYS